MMTKRRRRAAEDVQRLHSFFPASFLKLANEIIQFNGTSNANYLLWNNPDGSVTVCISTSALLPNKTTDRARQAIKTSLQNA
jgi:hypothetical protein